MTISIRISNFKAIGDAELSVREGLNILIGPNGAGKTCLLMVLKFLRDILVYGVARAVARAGGPRRTPRRGTNRFKLVVTTEYGMRTYRRRPRPAFLVWTLEVELDAPDEVPVLVDERVEIRLKQESIQLLLLHKKITPSGRIQVRHELAAASEFGRDLLSYWGQIRGVRKEGLGTLLNDFQRRIKQSAESNPDRSMLSTAAYLDDRIGHLMLRLANLSEYNIVPEIARRPIEPQPLPIMKPDGEGLADVLHALENGLHQRLDNARRQTLVSLEEWPMLGRHSVSIFRGRIFLSGSFKRRTAEIEVALEQIKRELTAGVGTVDDFKTSIDPTTGKRYVQFRSGSESFYPEEVSDGTIKWLAILVSILVPSSPVYLLEEPENFLHPWMQQRLIAAMREQSLFAKTIFVLTTHSSTVLNAAEVGEVLVVSADATGTTVSSVPDRADVEHALATSHFGLGDLWVGGAIDGVPAP